MPSAPNARSQIYFVFGSKKVLDHELDVDYTPFLREVVKFFQTGVAPVTPEETIGMYGFMEAADESKRAGGCPVKIVDVIEKNGASQAAMSSLRKCPPLTFIYRAVLAKE